MSWLQRGLFSMRRRSDSQSKEDESKTHSPEDTAAEKPATSASAQAQAQEQTQARAEGSYGGSHASNSKKQLVADSGLLDEHIEDVDGLFAKLSIVEMRQYEQLLQGRIENTQKQMRKVAGEHYPELINAADSVVTMDASSASVSMRLSNLRHMLEETKTAAGLSEDSAEKMAKHGEPARGVAEFGEQQQQRQRQQDSLQAKIYSIAAQVKVLVDTPEQIWKALESQRFLQATLLYLIAGEIHERLCEQSRLMSPSASQSAAAALDDQSIVDPLLAFPVIERQWVSVAPFREQIMAKAHQLLASTEDVSIEAFMSSICAITLLEDVDAETACTIFLSHRGEALRPLLDNVAARFGTSEESADRLDTALQELLGRIRQVLTDYVVIFGVPDDRAVGWEVESKHRRQHNQHLALGQQDGHGQQRKYASWMLTTLASISADTDLPVPPSLQPLWHGRDDGQQQLSAAGQAGGVDASEKRRSEMHNMKSRRRKSSIAGSVISSTIPASPMSISAAAEGHMADSKFSPSSAATRSGNAGHGHTFSSPAVPLAGAHINGEFSQPWTASARRGTHTSGVFMVAKYLPEEIAQFKPPLPRVLDIDMMQPDSESLNEADEDIVSLEYYMRDAKALLRALAAQVQPSLERVARHALDIWWRDMMASIEESVSAAVSSQVQSVADAAHIGSSIHGWETSGNKSWTRGFSWTTIASNAVLISGASGGSLYGSVIEPLLQQRARELQFAAVDLALSSPEAFLQNADVSDILSGHLPWRPFALDTGGMLAQEHFAVDPFGHVQTATTPSTAALWRNKSTSSLFGFTEKPADPATGSTVDQFVAEVQGGLEFLPVPVRSLGNGISGALLLAWRDGDVWWRQMNGAAALPEALVCARYFVGQWSAMADRLAQWGAGAISQAQEATAAGNWAAGAVEPDGGAEHMPYEVVLCIKGAWAMAVLAEVAHDVLATDTVLMRECWKQLGLSTDALAQKLQAVGRDLMEPWFAYLGTSMAHTWATEFDALYYRIPEALQRDVGATHHDIVRAWLASSSTSSFGGASAGVGVWPARYAALRRIAATTAPQQRAPGARHPGSPSAGVAVQCLAMRLRAQIQAVAGLSTLIADRGEMEQRVGRALAQAMHATVSAKQKGAAAAAAPGGSMAATEWDSEQLLADVQFMQRLLSDTDTDESYSPLLSLLAEGGEAAAGA
ncbi:hypothetical protein GQ54DRAFT_196569 [Martensiomyces pterosporus]|nr:hypothetical protein GQ54DRAFT_196569 [Martensiomyces pterosporus]